MPARSAALQISSGVILVHVRMDLETFDMQVAAYAQIDTFLQGCV
jgi:hypothetical protein